MRYSTDELNAAKAELAELSREQRRQAVYDLAEMELLTDAIRDRLNSKSEVAEVRPEAPCHGVCLAPLRHWGRRVE